MDYMNCSQQTPNLGFPMIPPCGFPLMNASGFPNVPPSGSMPKYAPPTQVQYVPVYVDLQGRPIQNMQSAVMHNFLPTAGLNQSLNQLQMQQQRAPWQPAPWQVQKDTDYGSPPVGAGPASTTSSDSGSTSGSVSPRLAPIRSKTPPGYNLDKDSWATVSDKFMEASAPKPPAPKRQPPKQNMHKKKRYGYRSKQNKIDEVYASLICKYVSQQILVSENEVIRGPDVIRLHVKKYDALCTINDALNAVESADDMKIVAVSVPLSMKNSFQKKGFLVYIKLERIDMVKRAQAILATFPKFTKCGVANVLPPKTTQV